MAKCLLWEPLHYDLAYITISQSLVLLTLVFVNINYYVTFHVAVKRYSSQATKTVCPKEAPLVQLSCRR